MRTLTATQLSNAKSLHTRAAVRANIRNKRWRWSELHYNANQDLYTDMAPATLALHRCRVDASGNVQTAMVETPTTQAQWETWTTQATGAVASSDCAIAIAPSPSDLNMRVFFTTTTKIRLIESANGGLTWGSPADVVAISGAVFVAADNAAVFYLEGGELKVQAKPYGSGSWTAGAAWAGTTFAAPNGVGASWDPATSTYFVAVAGDGQLWVAFYDPSADAWSGSLQIAPGGNGAAGNTLTFRSPSTAIVTDDGGKRWIIAYIDDFSGSSTDWNQPIVVLSRDGIHFGDEVAVDCWTWSPTHARASLAAFYGYAYLANNTTVCRAKTFDNDNADQNLTQVSCEEYRRETGPQGSRLWVTALDPSDAWRIPGAVSTAAEAAQPLAEIVVERGLGYKTALEWEPLDPYYIVSAKARHGRHGKRIEIEAIDGLGLLGLWSPAEPMSWQDKAVSWLAAELVASVGLQFSCPASPCALDYQVPLYTIRPGQNGLHALLDLLSLCGAVPWVLETGVIYAAELRNYGPASKLQIGDSAEILSAAFATQAPPFTGGRVVGYNASAGVGYSSEDADASGALGLRIIRTRYDARLSSDDAARTAARYYRALASESSRQEIITVPLRPDAEMYDLANILDSEVVNPSDNIRRLAGISEAWDGDANTYTSTLTFRLY